jgi:hypothetical protein
VATDFDAMFGDTRPFDIGVKVWLKACHSGDWFVAYRAQNVLVFFLFHLSGSQEFWDGILAKFQDTERLCFEGTRLVDLIAYYGELPFKERFDLLRVTELSEEQAKLLELGRETFVGVLEVCWDTRCRWGSVSQFEFRLSATSSHLEYGRILVSKRRRT